MRTLRESVRQSIDIDAASATQDITNASRNLISWDSVLRNKYGGFNLSADATIWTAHRAGTYVVGFQFLFSTDGGTGRRLSTISKNGTVAGGGTKIIEMETQFSATSVSSGTLASGVVTLAAGDDLYFEFFQNAGYTVTGCKFSVFIYEPAA